MISAALIMLAGTWTLQNRVDPITDARQANLALSEDGRILMFSCKASDRSFSAVIGEFRHGEREPTSVAATIRVDGGIAIATQLGFDGTYAVTLNPRDARSMLLGNDTLAVRLSAPRGSSASTDAVFALQGGAVRRTEFVNRCAELGVAIGRY
jgi:hypothetical protein